MKLLNPLPAVLLVVLAAPALAEGAVVVFDCKITQICDDAGTCSATDQPAHFALAPLAVAADGTGTYNVHYEEIDTELTWTTPTGPLIWYPLPDEQDVMLFAGGNHLVWQSMQYEQDGKPASSSVQFLTCDLPR